MGLRIRKSAPNTGNMENMGDSPGHQNAHDKLFRKVFSNKADALEFCLNFLPPELTQTVRFGDMVLDDTRYVTPEMADFDSDIVYRISRKGRVCKNNGKKRCRKKGVFGI